MNPNAKAQPVATKLFLPSKRAACILGALGLVALGAALWFRYFIVQNTELGIACEEGQQSFICALRLAVILLFVRGVFGWVALAAAAVNLWRPNVLVFGVGVVFALLGLVLYNTRVAAIAVPLLVLSLARPSPGGR